MSKARLRQSLDKSVRSHNASQQTRCVYMVIRHTSHVTRHTSHVTRHTAPLATEIFQVSVHCTEVDECVGNFKIIAAVMALLKESHTSNVTHHTSHVTHHTSHVTRHTSHVTRHTSHVTRQTSHVTRHTSPLFSALSPATPFVDWCRSNFHTYDAITVKINSQNLL
jgi:hypothetical protein